MREAIRFGNYHDYDHVHDSGRMREAIRLGNDHDHEEEEDFDEDDNDCGGHDHDDNHGDVEIVMLLNLLWYDKLW